MEFKIPEEKISEIRSAANILDIVSERVQLKKAGKNWIGLCPFHSEKTPSFTVSPDKQIYYCFGCGAGGNAISFLMKIEGLSFVEALKSLSVRYGIEIPEKKLTPDQQKRISERERLFDVNSLACSFFRENLKSESEGKLARDYLLSRSLDVRVTDGFALGFATDSWDSLLKFLRSRNVDPSYAEMAGLAVKGKNGSLYDRFRNRIVFPIHDVSGRITGFGGRVLDDSKPKYLNSPETRLYHKGKSLYGLSQARDACRSEGTVFIAEGYLDLIAFHQRGMVNSVATLGTALTVDQVRLLKGYATTMVLVYDSDEAGRAAAARSIDVFLKEGVDAYVLLLPDGHDPDSFLREYGQDGFKEMMATKKTVMDFYLDESLRKNGSTVAGKIKVVDDVCAILSPHPDKIERSLYARQAALKLGIDQAALLDRIEKKNFDSVKPAEKQVVFSRTPDSDTIRLERAIVSMMLQFPDSAVIEKIIKGNLVEYFSDGALKNSAMTIIETYRTEVVSDLASCVMGRVDDKLRSFLAALCVKDHPWTYEGCMGIINQFQAKCSRSEKDLLEKIREAERSNDQALLIRLLKEKQELAIRKRI